jgi:K+-sensing histidine kinase KdpD
VALLPYFDLANIVMLFLLTVVLVAMRFGRGPAVLAAFVSVAAFDFFCVPPRLSFAARVYAGYSRYRWISMAPWNTPRMRTSPDEVIW